MGGERTPDEDVRTGSRGALLLMALAVAILLVIGVIVLGAYLVWFEASS